MKLRIHENSLRLRLLRSDLAALLETGRIEQKIHFAADAHAFLIYALEHEDGLQQVEVRSAPQEFTIVLPSGQAGSWAETEQVGVYATVDLGRQGSLEVAVEKDFACLDLSDADNHDTFPHPQPDAIC